MWIDAGDRLPDLGRPVYVIGEHVADGRYAPASYRREEPGGWFWCSTEWRGSVGVTHWWDGPCRLPEVGYRPPCGPGDAGYKDAFKAKGGDHVEG